MGPCMSAMAPSVRARGAFPPKRWRWPIKGNAPDGSGALTLLLLLPSVLLGMILLK
ncbi:hypothetical protein RHMOL_Rhmol13G0061900 [Rhododendron molle]|uniref:Uncharacterized protein n=1 Tax=Rhododendron molle TaxID=49168 RepID=A0ACC0L4I6_RHOML|nr:hypothetical protein RHMOL_Rhmol13G0061900 [Rhododendron molle]